MSNTFLTRSLKNIKAYSLDQTTNSEQIHIDFYLWDMFENNEKKCKKFSKGMCIKGGLYVILLFLKGTSLHTSCLYIFS